MYDNEEEIKRKRRNLLIIIGVVAFLILLLLIFIFTRGSKKKTPTNQDVALQCELGVVDGIKPNESGVYTQEVTVEFKNITMVSKDAQLIKQKIGTTDNSRNKEQYTIRSSGNYSLYGYVQDSDGRTGTCEIKIKVNLASPTCELEVTEGTLGENGWYKSDVTVGFKTMNSGDSSSRIVKYYIEKDTIDLDTSKVIRADEPTVSIDTVKITDNQTTNVTGYVIDSNGTEGKCTLSVKKDSEKPTCKLKVKNGTPNSQGIYTDQPIVGINEAKDTISDIAGKGVGVKKNYTDETYTVTAAGTTKVYGYVKDQAGNEGTCSLEIKRPSGGGGTTPTPTPAKPGCSIKVSSGTKDSSGKYVGNVTVSLSKTAPSGSSISSYGLAESSATTNGKESLTVSSAGKHTIYGMVKASNGESATCQLSVEISSGNLLSTQVKVGDYVAYKPNTSYTSNVNCRTTETKQQPKAGWRVLSISGNEVTIISSGNVACYTSTSDINSFIKTLNSEAQKYSNSTYAKSASTPTCEVKGFNGCQGTMKCLGNLNCVDTSNTLYMTNAHYFIGTAASSTTIYFVSEQGSIRPGGNKITNGLRPVIVLKADTKTTGKDSSGAWILTK